MPVSLLDTLFAGRLVCIDDNGANGKGATLRSLFGPDIYWRMDAVAPTVNSLAAIFQDYSAKTEPMDHNLQMGVLPLVVTLEPAMSRDSLIVGNGWNHTYWICMELRIDLGMTVAFFIGGYGDYFVAEAIG